MTIKQLINHLMNYPQNLEVLIEDDDYQIVEIEEVRDDNEEGNRVIILSTIS